MGADIKIIIILLLNMILCSPLYSKTKDLNSISFKPNERKSNVLFTNYYEPSAPSIDFNAPDYKMPLDVNIIINFNKVNLVINLNTALNLIQQNGFAIVEQNIHYNLSRDDFVNTYKPLGMFGIPIFFSADTGLYLYHSLFGKVLQDIEENVFFLDIVQLTKVLLDDSLKQYELLKGDLKEASQQNIAYLSVAQKLINPNSSIPEFVKNTVANELTKIEAHRSIDDSDIFKYSEDYSQYVPRGHYTRNEKLEQYFKTMMWYGRMAFLLKGGPGELISKHNAKIQTMQACMLASSLKNTKVGDRNGLDVWDRIYTVTSFFIGFADDLTPKDYLWAIDIVYGSSFELNDLADEQKLLALRKKLSELPPSKIYGGTGNIVVPESKTEDSLDNFLIKIQGMHLMGQSFVPDSYVFQQLTYPNVGSYMGEPNKRPFTADGSFGNRSYIRGLDFMAVLGSSEAKKILTNDGDTNFVNYAKRFDGLTNEINTLSINDWNQNLYWSWLYCIKGLQQELPEGYPNFMRTQAWKRSRINTALASWTLLRHDTILQVKQGYAPPPASKLPVPPPGYVEPNLLVWRRLQALTSMTLKGLENLDLLTQNTQEQLNKHEKLFQQLLEISVKQLTNEELSSEDRKFFKNLPDTLALMVMDEEGQCQKTILVAGVHTVPVDSMVIEEGVGNIDLMIVACPLDKGMAFLTVGPVFSYYEFKHPMEDRLTNEEWQKMLESPQKPNRPDWYIPLMVQEN